MAKVPFPLSLDDELMMWVRQQASDDNRSVNNWIETKLQDLKSKKEDDVKWFDIFKGISEMPFEMPPLTKSKWTQKLEELQKAQEDKMKKK